MQVRSCVGIQARPGLRVMLAVMGGLALAAGPGLAAAEREPVSLPPRLGALQRVDGGVADVELLGLSAEGSRWLAGGQLRSVGPEELLSWGRRAAMLPGERVELVGGAVVAGTLTGWSDEHVRIVNELIGELVLPCAAVRSWQRSGHRLPVMAREQTTLLLTNGDWLTGSQLRLLEPALGREPQFFVTPGPADAAAITTEPWRIPADRVVAIHQAAWAGSGAEPSLGEAAGSAGDGTLSACAAVVGLQDGSWLPVAAIEADPEGERFQLHPCLPGGISLPAVDCQRQSVTGLLAVGSHVLPLAWLEPGEIVQEPRFGEPWPLTRGRSLADGPLAVRGLHAFTGFGLHAAARVAYQLPVSATRFLAVVAIDDTAGQGGSVVIRVRAGRERATSSDVFTSAVLRGGDQPLTVDVPLADAGWLELVVEPTEDGDILDRTLWLEPRLLTRRTSRTATRAPSPAASDALPGTFPGRP